MPAGNLAGTFLTAKFGLPGPLAYAHSRPQRPTGGEREAGAPQRGILEQLERFAAQVMPALIERWPRAGRHGLSRRASILALQQAQFELR